MPRRRRIGPATLSEIQQKAYWGWSGPNVLDHLEMLYQDGKVETVPALRTVQNIMRECAAPDPSGSWNVADADEEHIPIILAVLAILPVVTRGQRLQLTRREAELIVKISKAAPDLRPEEILDFTHAYMLCEEKRISSEFVDLVLAIKPWRDPESASTYLDYVGMPKNPMSVGMPIHVFYALRAEKTRQEGLPDEQGEPIHGDQKRRKRGRKKEV